MTEINLEDFTEFSKIKDIWKDSFHDKNGLNEFLNNIVMNMDYGNGYGKMLPNFSDIYVLVSKKDFPFEKLTLNHKISIDLSVAKQNYVLGYIWLCPWVVKNEGCMQYHFINFIDSRVSGLNITKYMIKKYEDQIEEEMEEEIQLFPFEVLSGAEYYWKKYFMEEYGIKNKTELTQMICQYEFKKSDIKWEHLISAFEIKKGVNNMENFATFKELSDYIENNYGEEEQIIIEDFMSYYLNEYRGFSKHNCEFTYKENLENDKTGELHKLALIGFEFLKKIGRKIKTNKT